MDYIQPNSAKNVILDPQSKFLLPMEPPNQAPGQDYILSLSSFSNKLHFRSSKEALGSLSSSGKFPSPAGESGLLSDAVFPWNSEVQTSFVHMGVNNTLVYAKPFFLSCNESL